MKWRTVLALIGISLLTQGCQLAWDATTNVVFETCLFTDTMTSRVHYCLQANEAWKEYLSHHGDGDYSPDFAKGFKAGYKDFLYGGGDTAAPPAPPLKYWKLRFQNHEGREASKMWSLGYAEGAMAAKASGARNLIIVPFNKNTPPPGPEMGAPGAPPGAPVLPPSATEIELPAPRPASGKVVPPQANKTSSTKPGASPVPQKAAGSENTQAGQLPDMASETVPAQPIRSILSNKNKAPATNPKEAPSGSALGTPGGKAGTAVPPRKSPSLPSQLPPPAPEMQLPLLESVPGKVGPLQNNKSNSAKPGVPAVPQKAVDSMSSRIGEQPAKLSDGVPPQPIRSRISPEVRSSSPAHSETMPVQSTRSLLSGNEPATTDIAVQAKNIIAAGQQRPALSPLPCSDGGTMRTKDGLATPASLAYGTGMAAMQGGNVEAGLCWLHSALKEDPNYAPAHQALMEYYQKVGDLSQAAAHRMKTEIQVP